MIIAHCYLLVYLIAFLQVNIIARACIALVITIVSTIGQVLAPKQKNYYLTYAIYIVITSIVYVSISVMLWTIPEEQQQEHWTRKYLIILEFIFPLSILHAASTTLPAMLFETYSVSINSAKNLISNVETRSVLAERYNKENSSYILNNYSLALAYIIGLAIGTGGFRFMVEFIVLVLIIVAIFSKSKIPDIHTDYFFKNIFVVGFYLIIVALIVIVVLFVLHAKMRAFHAIKTEHKDHRCLLIAFALTMIFIGLLFIVGDAALTAWIVQNVVAMFQPRVNGTMS